MPTPFRRAATALAAIAFTAIVPATACAQKLAASTWMPMSHEITRTMMEWAGEVERATDGRVSFALLPKAGASPQGTYDAIRNGVIDLSFTVHGYTPGRFTLTQIAELPFLGDSSEAVSVAYQRIHEKHFTQAGEHQGVKVLAVFTHGPGIVHNVKRTVQSVKDMDGLKFRVGGGMATEIARAIGVNATLKPAPESYELLSSGVMDGVFLPAESVEAYRLDKLVRHATTFPGGLYNTSFVMLMNAKRYDALSEADRRTVDRLAGVALARKLGMAWDRADRKGLAYMQAAGVTVTKAPAPFVKDIQDRVSGLENRWMEGAKAKGIANPAAVLKEFRQLATAN